MVIASLLERQRPPAIGEIAAHFRVDEAEARRGLRALAEYHGLVLRPESDEIWVAHPFSAVPTAFVVRTDEGVWWGNCAWCSLGVAHLVGGSARIETRIGAIEDPITIRIVDGELIDGDFVVHFPIPMHKAWDNVIYTCSVMLIFRNEIEVDEWCATRGIPKGDVRPIRQIWTFAQEWYGRHADSDWRKWSQQEAIEMFERHGLRGPIWSLSAASVRF